MHRSAFLLFLLLVTLAAGGCGILPGASPAPVFFHLDYDPPPISCRHFFDKGVGTRDFSTAIPFDRMEMTVLKPEGEVSFSGTYQWVAPPGRMVAEALGRDLSAGTLFPSVSMGENLSATLPPWELTGRIYTFAWEKIEGKGARAVLNARLTLVEKRGEDKILLDRTYRLAGPVRSGGNASRFAGSMSELVADLSTQLQRDLCALALERERP